MPSRILVAAFSAAFLFSALPFSAFSQDDEPVTRLDEVLVTPRRVPGFEIEESRFPGNATVITEEEIAESGAVSVVELLAGAEGVQTFDSRGFGQGADTGLSIRGFGNNSRNNALVLVDGIRQNRITGDEVHWQSIPVEQIERIEVIRGGSGSLYGEGALSGVVNIITKKGGDRPLQAEGTVETGSYGLFRSTTLVRGAADRFSYSLGATRHSTQGYRDRTDSRGTTLNLFGGIDLTPDTRLELQARDHQDVSGFVGGLTAAQVEQNRRHPGSFTGFFEEHLDTAGLRLSHKFNDAWSLGASLYDHRRESDSVTSSRFGTDTDTLGGGLNAGHQAAWGPAESSLVFGIDAAKDKAVTGSRTGAKSESNRDAYGLFIEEALTLWERLTATLGYRYDRSRYEENLTFPTFAGTLKFSGSSPRVGLTYQAADSVDLFANAARVFKAPNIDDLDAVLPPFNDSVDLKEQQADHAEIGVRWRAARWAKLEAAGFFAHTKDEILFNPFTFGNSNFTTRRAGLELSAEGEIGERGLSYYASYTLSKGKFHKGAFTGYELPLVPRHRAAAGLRVPVWKKLSAELDYLWVGRQFRLNDFNNRFPADIYGVVNARLRYRFPKAQAYFGLLNALDEEYEALPSSSGPSISTGQNPAPPRTWVAGVSWDF